MSFAVSGLKAPGSRSGCSAVASRSRRTARFAAGLVRACSIRCSLSPPGLRDRWSVAGAATLHDARPSPRAAPRGGACRERRPDRGHVPAAGRRRPGPRARTATALRCGSEHTVRRPPAVPVRRLAAAAVGDAAAGPPGRAARVGRGRPRAGLRRRDRPRCAAGALLGPAHRASRPGDRPAPGHDPRRHRPAGPVAVVVRRHRRRRVRPVAPSAVRLPARARRAGPDRPCPTPTPPGCCSPGTAPPSSGAARSRARRSTRWWSGRPRRAPTSWCCSTGTSATPRRPPCPTTATSWPSSTPSAGTTGTWRCGWSPRTPARWSPTSTTAPAGA